MPKTSENAVHRLRARISDRIASDRDRPRGFRRSQRGLAEKIGISEPTLSELLNGPASTRGLLAHLDKIAEYFGVPPSLLIHRNDTALMELQQQEYRLITHWRSFPPSVRERIMEMFEYFAGLLPEEREERRVWNQWRRLSPESRARLEAVLTDAVNAETTQKRAIAASAGAPDRTAENAPRAQTRRR